MITLHFSHWWLLAGLAVVLLVILRRQDSSGIGAAIGFCFTALVCLAIFLIALAFLVGAHFAHS